MSYLPGTHWLIFDKDRRITGCQCGFAADVDQDSGYGDSVVRHLFSVAQERDAVLARALARAENAEHALALETSRSEAFRLDFRDEQKRRRQAERAIAKARAEGAKAVVDAVERQTDLTELVHFDRPSDFRKGVLSSLMAAKAAAEQAGGSDE